MSLVITEIKKIILGSVLGLGRLLYWLFIPAIILMASFMPKLLWDLSFKDYLDLLMVLVWPITVLLTLFFFRKVVTYLFFSMDGFNFFGAKGRLRNVNEIIEDEVGKRFVEKDREKNDALKIEESKRQLDSSKSDNGRLYELAKDLIRQLQESRNTIAAQNLEIRRLRGSSPESASSGVAMPGLLPRRIIQGSLPMRYWLAEDGRRYVFPNEETFRTWFPDEGRRPMVQRISDDELTRIPIGGNITYRPGSRLVKIKTDDKVYAVARGGVLRWVSSAAVGESIYGNNWRSYVDEIPDAFFINYAIGPSIGSGNDYDRYIEEASAALP